MEERNIISYSVSEILSRSFNILKDNILEYIKSNRNILLYQQSVVPLVLIYTVYY